MAIRVTCSCGKQLKAKDEAADRRIRCPACQSVVHVPAMTELPHTEISPQPVEPVPKAKRRMAWLPFVAASIAALAIIPFVLPRRSEILPAPAPAPPLEQAAPTPEKSTTQTVSPKVAEDDEKLQALLAKADLAYAEDADRISQIVVNMVNGMKKTDQALTPEEALEGSLRWAMPGYFAREKPSEFAEYATMYVMTRRGKEMTHRQAIRQLHILARAVDFRSEEPSESEIEAAITNASPGCQLAIAEARKPIPGNDPVADYYGGINSEVAAAYGMAEQEMAPAVALAVVELANIDENTAPDEILLAARNWTKLTEAGRPDLDEFLKLYMAIRQQKKSHAVACEILCKKRPDDSLPEPAPL